MRLLVFLFLLLSVNGYTQSLRVLYIGNSLTYTNELPALVTALGNKDSVVITYSTFLYPNYSLEDHWGQAEVRQEIEKGQYNLIILQQGPSAMPDSRVLLLEYAKRFADVATKANAKTAFYTVWPARQRLADLDNVIRSYDSAAKVTNSLILPAGLAWKYAWQLDPAIELYGPDEFHPSVAGSLLAAITIYIGITGRKNLDFINLDTFPWKEHLTEKLLNQLKTAALRANNHTSIK